MKTSNVNNNSSNFFLSAVKSFKKCLLEGLAKVKSTVKNFFNKAPKQAVQNELPSLQGRVVKKTVKASRDRKGMKSEQVAALNGEKPKAPMKSALAKIKPTFWVPGAAIQSKTIYDVIPCLA